MGKRDTVSTIMIILVLTKILGFLKIRIIAQLFGVSRELDIFWAAFTIPDTLFNIMLAGAINAAIIPVFSSVLHKDGSRAVKSVFKRLNFLYIVTFLIISVFFYIFAPNIGELLTRSEAIHTLLGTTSQITQEDVDLFAKLMRIMLLSPLFLGVSSLVTAYLQAQKRFFVTALAPLFYNLAMIAGALIFVKWFGLSTEGIAYSVVFGSILHLITQLPVFIKQYQAENTLRKGFFSLIQTVFSKEVLKVARLAAPRVLGLLGEQVNVVINTIISFTLSAGALSAFKFAFSLHLFPVQIFGGAISQVALPNMSEAYAKGDKKEFSEIFNRSIRQILFLILPIVVVLLILRLPLVRLAYGVGEFDWWATVITSWCLALLSVAILGQAVVIVILRAFYAMHETKLPLVATFVAIVVNIVAAYLMTNFFSNYFDWRPIVSQMTTQIGQMNGEGLVTIIGSFISDSFRWMSTRSVSDAAVGGLAVATSVSFFAEMIVGGWLLNKKIRVITFEKTIKPVLPMVYNSILMGIGMYYIYRLSDFSLDTSRTVQVVILTAVSLAYGALSYSIGSKVFKIPEFEHIEKRAVRIKTAILSRLNILNAKKDK